MILYQKMGTNTRKNKAILSLTSRIYKIAEKINANLYNRQALYVRETFYRDDVLQNCQSKTGSCGTRFLNQTHAIFADF
ncbi:hypothetical protein EUGRSUZ_F01004 [Eucalyptus grandis]|uniref:Uncharacterized protein n=2 Tax=Eucalyptus grandis TaxID=71139 RepID=A0ACC3KEP5_EUCGR|nr:hypothetical protein EUGRSUZ_F01004 [Eucalyptus grandis]